MPRGDSANWPAYCNGGDFGSREEPSRLIAVNAHRSHSKVAACLEACWLREAGTGEWKRSGPSRNPRTQTSPVRSPEPPEGEGADALEPEDGEPLAATPAPIIPEAPPSWPSQVTGTATMPKAPPANWGPPAPPALKPTTAVAYPPLVYDQFDWAVATQGFEGTFEEFVNQSLYLCFKYVYRWLPKMARVPDEEVAWLVQFWANGGMAA